MSAISIAHWYQLRTHEKDHSSKKHLEVKATGMVQHRGRQGQGISEAAPDSSAAALFLLLEIVLKYSLSLILY